MEAPLNPRLQQALSLAMQGFYLFPLEENSKLPEKGYSWAKRSTRNPETIKSWFKDRIMGWEHNPNIAIDCGKSGVLVIDVDTKDGKDGDATFANLAMDHGAWPKTRMAKTMSGAKHYFYWNTANVSISAGKLGVGVDTRGIGGYVVAPGSYVIDKERGIEGGYEWLNKEEIVDMPEWLAEKLSIYRHVTNREKEATISEDDPANIDRAIDWLENAAKHAVEGDGGDHLTFATAAKVREFGCSEEKTLELLLDHWNEHCSPEWDPEDLQHKVANAFSYGRNATGAASAEAEFDINEKPPSSAKVKEPRRAEGFELDFNVDKIPLREWLFGDLALAKKVTVLVAPGGAGKSTFSLMMAISKATGRNILDIEPIERGAVWVYNNEDDKEEMKRRAGAIMQHYGIPVSELFNEDVKGKAQRCFFYMNSGEEDRFRIASKKEGQITPLDMKWAIQQIQENSIKLMIVDPLVSTHPCNENDNGEMEAIADMYRTIAQATGCAVILIHHTKKPQDASSDGHEGNMDTLRGASALSGVARIIATFFGMSAKRAKEYGIAEDMRWKYVGLMMAKANMSKATSDVRWFEKVDERIGVTNENMDGEEVGVLRPAKLQKLERKIGSPENAPRQHYWAGVFMNAVRSNMSEEFDCANFKKVRADFYALAKMEPTLKESSIKGTFNRAKNAAVENEEIEIRNNSIFLNRNSETIGNTEEQDSDE
jgi:AAA domain/Bifunctional DNA primase/polymerase, N-terminal